jgi:hypothetical protein
MTTVPEEEERREEEEPEVDEDLASLLQAIETGADLAPCIQSIARNFPDFIASPVIKSLPNEILFEILANAEITYPYAERISQFFVWLFDRGEPTVRLFVDLIPYDELSAGACEEIAAKLASVDCELEARSLERVANLYRKIEGETNDKPSDDPIVTAELESSTRLLERVNAIFAQTSLALKHTTEEIAKRDALLQEKDAAIARLKSQKRSKR